MSILYDGIGNEVVTMKIKASEAVTVGDIVKNTADGIQKASDGDEIFGMVVSVNCGWAGVVTKGMIKAEYTGTAPAINRAVVVSAGANKVKSDESGTDYKVFDVDASAKTVTFYL